QTPLVTPCYSWRPRLAAHRRRLPVEVTASRISLLLRPPNSRSSSLSLVAPPRRGFFSRGFGLGAGSRLRLRPNKATSSSASASSSSRVSPWRRRAWSSVSPLAAATSAMSCWRLALAVSSASRLLVSRTSASSADSCLICATIGSSPSVVGSPLVFALLPLVALASRAWWASTSLSSRWVSAYLALARCSSLRICALYSSALARQSTSSPSPLVGVLLSAVSAASSLLSSACSVSVPVSGSSVGSTSSRSGSVSFVSVVLSVMCSHSGMPCAFAAQKSPVNSVTTIPAVSLSIRDDSSKSIVSSLTIASENQQGCGRTTMLNPTEAAEKASELYEIRSRERKRLDTIRLYLQGRPELTYLPPDTPRELQALAKMARVPLMKLIVNATTQQMFVDGYQSADTEAADTIWREIWQSNRWDKKQIPLHKSTAAYGVAYGAILPAADDDAPP